MAAPLPLQEPTMVPPTVQVHVAGEPPVHDVSKFSLFMKTSQPHPPFESPQQGLMAMSPTSQFR